MREVNLELVSKYEMGVGVGNLADNTACVVAQAAILDALTKGETLTEATDALQCACPVLRVLAIALNDIAWWPGGNAERTKTLRPLLGALLDSRVSPELVAKRASLAADVAKRAAECFAAESAAKWSAAKWSAAESAAKYAAESAAKYAAESAAKYAAESAAEYAESAAKYAAESAAKYAEYAAESAAEYAEYAEYAAEYAKWSVELVTLRTDLLATWWAIEAIK